MLADAAGLHHGAVIVIHVIDDVRQDVLLLEQLAAALGFLATLFGQRDVNPTSELVCLVPCALAMPEQYEFVCHTAEST